MTSKFFPEVFIIFTICVIDFLRKSNILILRKKMWMKTGWLKILRILTLFLGWAVGEF